MKRLIITAIAAVMVMGVTLLGAETKTVNVYSDRHYEADKKLYEEFEKTTGIKVNVLLGKSDELLERVIREGKNTNADVFITADAGRLHKAKESGVLAPIVSKEIEGNIPKNLKDRENYWIGLTLRARVIAYAKERVKPTEISTYEELAQPKWNKKVVMRSSTNIYNQSLMASFISLVGEKKSSEWAKGVVANFARDAKGNDRDQIKSIAAGEGDVTLVNTYYYGNMLNSSDEKEVEAAKKVGLIFPNQKSEGTHINISGAGVLKYGKNSINGVKLIEFLTAKKAQSIFAEANYEYPANSSVEPSEFLKSLGAFKKQNIDLTILGENNSKAVRIFDEAGWK